MKKSDSVFMSLLLTNTVAKVTELEDNIREVYQHSKDNRKETGRLEGITHLCYVTFDCWAELKDDNADTQKETHNVIFPTLSTLKKSVNSQSNLGRLTLKKQEDMWLQN